MHEEKKRGFNRYSRTDLGFISYDIVEELRDLDDGEVTSTLLETEKLGYTELLGYLMYWLGLEKGKNVE